MLYFLTCRSNARKSEKEKKNREEESRINSLIALQALGESQWVPSKTDKPVMSARWQNKSFQHSSSYRNIILTITLEKSTFVGAQKSSRGVPVHYQNTKSENKCNEEGKKSSFTLLMSPVPQSGTAQCQERRPQPTISLLGLCESTVNAWLPQMARCCPRGPLFSCPNQNTKGIGMAK